MKIIEKKPISLSEVAELVKKTEEEDEKIKKTRTYIKKFRKLTLEEAKNLEKELKNLGILKLTERHIIKIIDLLPEDPEDVRKIFVGEDVSLEQDEIEKILNIVNKYK